MFRGTALHLELTDGVALITFDQQGARANTLSTHTWTELDQAVAAVTERTDVNGLILQSAKDGMFIAGADLKELAALPSDNPEPTRTLLQLGHQVLAKLESTPFPTVAAIDGACLGGGLEVALACDYRLAGSNPKFKIGLPEVKLGLIPGWGGTQRLPRCLGLAKGAELLVTGQALGADDAWQIGLVDVVYPSDELAAAALRCVYDSESADRITRRKTKLSPMTVESLSGIEKRIKELPAEEQSAAGVAFKVLVEGCQVSLADGLVCETNSFLPLLASETARKKLATFFKK